MREIRGIGAFSLIEVVIAVGIFAFAVVAILALLPLTARQSAGSRDLQIAARLGDAVKLATESRVPPANYGGFTALELVAARDGSGVRPRDPAETGREQYFLIDVVPSARAPLQYADGTPLLVLTARVSWPYRTNAGAVAGPPTPEASRASTSFFFALRP